MIKCKECGFSEDDTKYSNGKDLLAKGLCFSCDYWTERIDRQNLKTQAVIKGEVYQIGDEKSMSSFRGFDGDKFVIKFNDGREVTTTNLWYNGKVPSQFRDRLKDNATFVRK